MQPKPPTIPPVCAEFQSKFEAAIPGLQAVQLGFAMMRSLDGKIRFDQPNLSIIADLAKTIILNHLTLEAQEIPHAPSFQMPKVQLPGVPSFTPPQLPLNVQELGKRLMNGIEVEGKLFKFAPPALPGMPQPPSVPHLVEVWTSPQFQLPLASRITGELGMMMTFAKKVNPCQPPAASFQIPAGYKLLPPPHAPVAST